MNPYDTDVRLVWYLDFLHTRAGGGYEIFSVQPREESDGRVLAVAYRDVPERGYVTGFTYGASLVSANRDVRHRELTITMRSTDTEWARVPAALVAAFRGMREFNFGNVIGHVRPYVDHSPMSSVFLVNPVNVWRDRESESRLNGPILDGVKVGFVGVYPIHRSEFEYIRANKVKDFLTLGGDFMDPLRAPVV